MKRRSVQCTLSRLVRWVGTEAIILYRLGAVLRAPQKGVHLMAAQDSGQLRDDGDDGEC